MRRFDKIMAITLFSGTIVAGLLLTTHVRDLFPAMNGLTPDTLPKGRSADYYAAVHDRAAAASNWQLAAVAAREETARAPEKPAAWHRLAMALTEQAGAPTVDALRALNIGIETSPITTPAQMAWRVEFMQAHWAAIPDPLTDIAIAHIGFLAELPESWQRRETWCQTFTAAAPKKAACDTLGTQTES